MARKAFITGVTGQDGSYLTDLLLSKGYEVHGLLRQSTEFTPDKWGSLTDAMRSPSFKAHHGDLTDGSRLRDLIADIAPDEIYNLASQSHVGVSFEQPENSSEVTALGPLRLLDAIRRTGIECRFYQASSSEMFGLGRETPQHENTRFYPRNPYACAKVYAHYLTQSYREAHALFAVSGMLFNHESERRGEHFVTRKITRAIGRILAGTQHELSLGNTDARRDWGYAPDYVETMWLMLQQDTPRDFVVGTGETHSVQEFIDTACAIAGLDPKSIVRYDAQFTRPAEAGALCADARAIQAALGWEPKVRFQELVRRMVQHDTELAQREKAILGP